MQLKPFKRRRFSWLSDPCILVLPQATCLDLALRAQYIAATCCRPVLTDLRRGFEIPGQSSPLGGSPSNEGWAQEGCSDSFKILEALATTDAITDDGFQPVQI